jgi:hypothetical protein
MKKIIVFAFIAVVIAVAAEYIYKNILGLDFDFLLNKGGFPMAIKNYKQEVDTLAAKFDLPPDFLMALIILESSGRKKVPARYEAGTYNKLKMLQDGKIDKFEDITKSDLKGVKDKTLKVMASSHGPFQIMGYKKYFLKIPIDSLTGKKNMFFAVKWINLSYGDMLRKGEFKDAFHFHNAGKRYPLTGGPMTHDPKYVENGLSYQKYFKQVIYRKK